MEDTHFVLGLIIEVQPRKRKDLWYKVVMETTPSIWGTTPPPPFAPSPLPDFPFSECFIIMTIMFEHIKSLGKYLCDVYIIPFVFWLLRGFCGVIGKVEK